MRCVFTGRVQKSIHPASLRIDSIARAMGRGLIAVIAGLAACIVLDTLERLG
jgi:hypothetical protein